MLEKRSESTALNYPVTKLTFSIDLATSVETVHGFWYIAFILLLI